MTQVTVRASWRHIRKANSIGINRKLEKKHDHFWDKMKSHQRERGKSIAEMDSLRIVNEKEKVIRKYQKYGVIDVA